MKPLKVAVAIPTFNRKELLVKCLEAVAGQTLKPAKIFVIDNHSSDGTPELLHSLGYDLEVNGVPVSYNYLEANGGGAMGFSLGMQLAYEEATPQPSNLNPQTPNLKPQTSNPYDAFWMLDDDGLPMPDCLERLSDYVEEYGYVTPVLMDINHPDQLNGAFRGSLDPTSLQQAYGGGELLKGYVNPFNGGLFSRKAVSQVGFPKRELFIYGDEMNYDQRMTEAGYPPVGIFSARHCHPVMLDTDVHFLVLGHFKPVPWKMYCMSRNKVYNKKTRRGNALRKVAVLTYYYVISQTYLLLWQRSIRWVKLFHEAFFDGLHERWGGEKKYMQP